MKSDFLVIGSGSAGLSFALKAAERGSVTIVTKGELNECNTNYAQGGICSEPIFQTPLRSISRIR
jgi:L-aspartate oxidase